MMRENELQSFFKELPWSSSKNGLANALRLGRCLARPAGWTNVVVVGPRSHDANHHQEAFPITGPLPRKYTWLARRPLQGRTSSGETVVYGSEGILLEIQQEMTLRFRYPEGGKPHLELFYVDIGGDWFRKEPVSNQSDYGDAQYWALSKVEGLESLYLLHLGDGSQVMESEIR